ncbi:hypothetical protein EGW08_017750 [Elysia chlorotica]|uniref:Sulfotransferase domain-containing protein n=1 Tax=Elysia chlorotica TaxID=188477 RepID=A0A433SYU5_ELYCH|nr:hypothetical protein EGW08_017750 [Elysia chlorotica]
MKKQLRNILVAIGIMGMMALGVLHSGSRLCSFPVVQTVAREETVINLRENRDSRGTVQEKPGPRQKVVILTYMRSGSSLTGNILQRSPEVFYVYEPLWYIGKVASRKYSKKLSFVNGTDIE